VDTKHINDLKSSNNFKSIKIGEKFHNKLLMLNKLSYIPPLKSVIKKLLEKNDIDLVHFNESFNPYFLSINPILNKFKVKSITTAHGCANYEAGKIVPHPLVGLLEKISHLIYYPPLLSYEILNLPKIPHYICVTKGVKKQLTKIGRKFWYKDFTPKMRYIPNGIDLKKFSLRTPDDKYLKKYKKTENEIIILFSGGLVIRKLPFLLIKSFYLLLKEVQNVRLIFVGGGRLSNLCKILVNSLNIQDKVDFLGYVEHNEIPKILSIANIFVLPSIYETPGISLLEAMAMKVPVIASNLPDINELIINKKNGILFDNDNDAIKNLYKKLKELIMDEQLRSKISENEYQFVKKNHNINLITNRIYLFYKNLIK